MNTWRTATCNVGQVQVCWNKQVVTMILLLTGAG